MSANIEGRQPDDLSRINVTEEWEVHWWSAKFSVTPEELHAAVKEVGPSAEEVQKKLKEAARKSFQKSGED